MAYHQLEPEWGHCDIIPQKIASGPQISPQEDIITGAFIGALPMGPRSRGVPKWPEACVKLGALASYLTSYPSPPSLTMA